MGTEININFRRPVMRVVRRRRTRRFTREVVLPPWRIAFPLRGDDESPRLAEGCVVP